jgi:hypothetical protein
MVVNLFSTIAIISLYLAFLYNQNIFAHKFFRWNNLIYILLFSPILNLIALICSFLIKISQFYLYPLLHKNREFASVFTLRVHFTLNFA